MVWIQVEATQTVQALVPSTVAYAFVADVLGTAELFPGVEETESLGDDLYRFRLAERRAVGEGFRGEYVARYRNDGRGHITWTTVRGNMTSEGEWTVEGDERCARISVRMRTALDAPVPAILKTPLMMFTRHETQRAADTQLERIRGELEARWKSELERPPLARST